MIITDEKIENLVQLAFEIKQNPSQVLHCGKPREFKRPHEHVPNSLPVRSARANDLSMFGNLKYARQTPKNPVALCQHVLRCLECDLTYDNRARAKKSIKEAIIAIKNLEIEQLKRRKESDETRKAEIEKIKNSLKTSTGLHDSFWEILPCYSNKNWKRINNGFECATDYEKISDVLI